MAKNETKVQLFMADPNATPVNDLTKMEGGVKEAPSLAKSILRVLNAGGEDTVERLAFEVDPSLNNEYQALYKGKVRLIPDFLLKRIAIQDDLVAAILNARSNQLSSFGRPQPDRFSTGFKIEPRKEVMERASAEEKKAIQARIEKATKKLLHCGDTRGWSDDEKMSFSQWLYMSTRDALTVGRIATEIIYVLDEDSGKQVFHGFRPIDAGTIFKASKHKAAAQSVRHQAKLLLEQLKNEKFESERFMADEYAWVQVIDGKPVQVFADHECLVHNFYPVTDVALNGYPLTPIDTVISAVTTHINITTHNKLYFQSGRATRGMLVIKSNDIQPKDLKEIRSQFNNSINNVSNSWRMPVFSVGGDDDIVWSPIDNGGRDMEFQYMSDTNARVILSAFQMSPEELPGYAHLSRGTNNQALSESNNEYQLEAHRDLGIRPLIKHFEDFANESLLPLIDEGLAKVASLHLVGINAETAEKESIRLQQDMPVHMTFDEVLAKVEKTPIGKRWGGEFPLNASFQAILDKYMTVGQILEQFFGVEGAAKDPQYAYVRDPFWFQNVQLQQAQQQMQMQQQQMQAQAQQPQQGQLPPGQDGGEGQPEASAQAPQGQEQQQGDAQAQQNPQQEQGVGQPEQDAAPELTQGIDQALGLLGKSEKDLPPTKRRILAQHKKMVKTIMDAWEQDSRKALDEILDVAEKHAPKG